MPNAFALPGGYVVVTTSLLELADRPEEIAGVVAHEVSHVTLKHGFRKVISAAGPFLILKLFSGGGGLLSMVGEGSGMLAYQSFSQEYELEADAAGWQCMVKAGLDPRGLADMLRKLNSVHHSYTHGYDGFAALSSHPPTPKRLRVLDEKWKKLKETNFQKYPPEPK
jgi:predicted Zn-dependent protease